MYCIDKIDFLHINITEGNDNLSRVLNVSKYIQRQNSIMIHMKIRLGNLSAIQLELSLIKGSRKKKSRIFHKLTEFRSEIINTNYKSETTVSRH